MRVMAEAVEPRARVYIYAHENRSWENRDKLRRQGAALLQDQSSGFWLAPRTGPRCTGHVRAPGSVSRRAWEHQANFRRQNGSCFGARLAAGLIQSPRVRTRIGSLRSGHAGGPSEWCCRVGGSKSLCFLIHPHHTGIGRRPPAAQLCAACPSETTTSRGPSAWLAACVVDVSRRCE